jgi:putative transposase
MSNNAYRSSARSTSDLKAHLVLVTKYRRKVISPVILARLTEVVNSLCYKWGCEVIEFNGESDHVHLLFSYYPQLQLSKFVNNLKSTTFAKSLPLSLNAFMGNLYFGTQPTLSPRAVVSR